MKTKLVVTALVLGLMLISNVSAMGLAGSTFGVGPGTLSGSYSGPNPVFDSQIANAPGGKSPVGTSYWSYNDPYSGRTFYYAYNSQASAYFYGGGSYGMFETGGITPEGFMASGIRGMGNGLGGSFGNGAGAF